MRLVVRARVCTRAWIACRRRGEVDAGGGGGGAAVDVHLRQTATIWHYHKLIYYCNYDIIIIIIIIIIINKLFSYYLETGASVTGSDYFSFFNYHYYI